MTARAVRLIPPLETYPQGGRFRADARRQGPARWPDSWRCSHWLSTSLAARGAVPGARRLRPLRPSAHAGGGRNPGRAFVWPLRAGGGLNAVIGNGAGFPVRGEHVPGGTTVPAFSPVRPPGRCFCWCSPPPTWPWSAPGPDCSRQEGSPGRWPARSASYQWFIGYALLDRMAQPPRAGLEAARDLRAFLGEHGDARFPREPRTGGGSRRARRRRWRISQLKGLKLMLWAAMLAVGYCRVPADRPPGDSASSR